MAHSKVMYHHVLRTARALAWLILGATAAVACSTGPSSSGLEAGSPDATLTPRVEATQTPDSDEAAAATPDSSPTPGLESGAEPGSPPQRDVPPLDLPPTGPGDDSSYDALVADLDRFVTPEQRAAGVPWPDLRNPDPVAAYQSCSRFQNWMTENNTTPSLVEAYTAANSPERGWDLQWFSQLEALDLLATPARPPYVMRVEDLVHPAGAPISDALLAAVPEGSAAVIYWDSLGRSDLVRPDGTVYDTAEGWSDVGPWVAIMAPTEFGWQVWWDELADFRPPGEDDQGPPTTSGPAVEV